MSGQARGAAAELLRHLEGRQCKVTLSLDDSAERDWIDAARHDPAGHELAILAGKHWYSVDNHRGRFAEQLSQGIQHAQAAGCTPTTLALPAGHLAEHLDLLVKHGISAVRTARAVRPRGLAAWWRAWRSASPCTAAPHALRWGLWEFDGSLSLVEHGLRRTLKAISGAAATGGLAHVAVDLERLAAQGPSGWKLLDRTLEHVARLREQKAIEQQTVSGVAAQLARTRQSPPARSILRPAA
ncbi:MAG TPA: hypothetical protein VGN42_18080 [Pirellulales bacterium]|nr:hypothetical protein [Pirellulales bacterium]